MNGLVQNMVCLQCVRSIIQIDVSCLVAYNTLLGYKLWALGENYLVYDCKEMVQRFELYSKQCRILGFINFPSPRL